MFDEGHQLFDAADDAFSLHLSGREAADYGVGCVAPRTADGIVGVACERAEDLLGDDRGLAEALADALAPPAAFRVPDGETGSPPRTPVGPAENFLALARQQVYARNVGGDAAYTLEAAVQPSIPGLHDAAAGLEDALASCSRLCALCCAR